MNKKPSIGQRLKRRFWLAGCAATALLTASVLQATPICQWKDEKGRTHIADSVPDQFKDAAVCTPSRRFELTIEQKREAEQRKQRQAQTAAQARAASAQANAPARAASSGPSGAAATAPALPQPAQQSSNNNSSTSTSECAAAWRAYNASMDCFAPFRNATGGIKAEAYSVCPELRSPDPKCGSGSR